MRLLVGLGNPGEEYLHTRHNAGFVCLDAVALALEVKKWREVKGGKLAEVQLEGSIEKALLFKPMQFMNTSGIPVQKVANYYKIASPDIAIVADDVYITPGTARIRDTGGDGGHNGWKSIIKRLDPDTFCRVRIGVGIYEQHPEIRQNKGHLEAYVLKPLPVHDRKIVARLIDKLVPDLIKWLSTGEMEHTSLHL